MSSLRDNKEAPADRPDNFYLPDFCAPMAVFGVVLISEIVAIALTLARQDYWGMFFSDLAKTSLLMVWIGLATAAALCATRSALARFSVPAASALTFAIVTLVIIAVSEAVFWIGHFYGSNSAGFSDPWFPDSHGFFLSRNVLLGIVVTGLALRYFYVSHQWQRNVENQAQARIHALQARIRPHFLFNSMNTIAALTRQNPVAAEAAVEDLADLFRASLSDSKELIRIEQELEIAQVYLRMEQQRLGDRLRIDWKINELPRNARIPSLTLQPLLENAIYHGVEPLREPGAVEVSGRRKGNMIYIRVRNQRPIDKYKSSPGNRIALDNIRERLLLAFGPGAGLSLAVDETHYEVTLAFPFKDTA